ncbi:hypothetical protein I203_107912 [Kwoniella mangroviensis CBS 8507]|uniref:hypothetical protein n=1 Tax=Kwoniella mangroviensis CBS 8507 TaxID=1296122 RepID=UPI00080D3D7D|nr:uncharacterized protein I203_04806 [Kwoniella mangroviensis CBS 8507]OCF65788.1 hypothetical protein I203_04806 [Kwoniella mangroviensis CBS 8507]
MSNRGSNSHYYTSGATGSSLGSIPEGEAVRDQQTNRSGDGTSVEEITAFLEQFKMNSSNAPFSAEHRRGDSGSGYDGSSVPHSSTGPRSVYDMQVGDRDYSGWTSGGGHQAGTADPGDEGDLQTHAGDHRLSDYARLRLQQNQRDEITAAASTAAANSRSKRRKGC